MNLQGIKKVLLAAGIGEFMPHAFAGIVQNWVEGKTPKQFYHWVIEHAGEDWFEEFAPKETMVKVQSIISENNLSLDWLNLEWFVNTIGKKHKDIAFTIMTSSRLKDELSRQAVLIKARLEGDKE